MKDWTDILFAINRRLYKVKGIGYKKFGYRSMVYKPMRIIGKKYIEIGEKSYILHGARMEAYDTYGDVKYKPLVSIGNNVAIGNDLFLAAANKVTIKDGTLISSRVFITDLDHNIDKLDEPIIGQGITVKETEIGENCFIGVNASILSGVKIGKNCVVGANAVVTKDVPDNSIVAGVPAKIIGTRN